MMTPRKSLLSKLARTAVLCAAAAVGMGGCELKCRSEPQGPAESIGRSIDKTIDDVKDIGKKDKVKIEIKD